MTSETIKQKHFNAALLEIMDKEAPIKEYIYF